MKNILVPIDFNEKSKSAVQVALQLAQKENATVHLLHALDLPMRLATKEPNSFPEELYFIKLAKSKFKEYREATDFKNVEVKEILELDTITRGVLQATKKYAIDFIVMGSNGASGIKEIFIGSNAEKVVRNSEAPVLIIKKPESHFEVKKIVFACDFTSRYASAMEKAMQFAELFDAEIHLLYINTAHSFKTTKQIRKLTSDFMNQFQSFKKFETHVYNDLRIEDGVMNFCAENDIDLVCMFPSGRKGIAHFFNGSISEDLINHAQKPILTIKLPK